MVAVFNAFFSLLPMTALGINDPPHVSLETVIALKIYILKVLSTLLY